MVAPFVLGPEQEAETRQEVLRSTYDALNARRSGLQNLPVFLEECIEKRVWESPRKLASGGSLEPVSFHDFIHKPFPVGLGSSYETIEETVAAHPALADQWERLTGRVVQRKRPSVRPADTVPVASVRTDGGTQSRAGIDDSVVSEYAETIDALPPVIVFYDGVSYWLGDGFHRVAAHVKAGRSKIRADVRQGGQRDAILYSVGANSAHGIRRTNADKRRAVELLLRDEEWSKRSDRWIAERCGVGHQLVATLRRALDDSSNASPPTRTTRDGREYPTERKSPERSMPAEHEPQPSAPERTSKVAPEDVKIARQALAEIEQRQQRTQEESELVSRTMANVRRMSPQELYDFEEQFNEFLASREGAR